jgi:predicted dehydrogenase
MSSPDRRTFLGAALAASAAPCLASAPPARPAEVGVGCVGVGNRGTALLRNLLALPGVAVRAICDIKAAHADRARALVTGAGQPAPTVSNDWKRLLEAPGVDAVVSALPCDLHAANYLDVIAAGKHLYGEKPMCLTLADCDRVVRAATASPRLVVQIGFQRRADPRFIETVEQVHKGELGDLVEGRVLWSNAWGPLYDWFGLKRRSGDWMVEQAVHNWDVMNWANRCLPVRAMGLGRDNLFRSDQRDRDVHDYYSAVVEYANGVIVNILHSWVAPGRQGAFTRTFNDEYTRLIGTRAGIDFNTGTFSYRKELNRPDRVGHSAVGDVNNTRLALAAFLDSVRNSRPPVATVRHGRDAVLACLLVREAVYRKRVVTVKELPA